MYFVKIVVFAFLGREQSSKWTKNQVLWVLMGSGFCNEFLAIKKGYSIAFNSCLNEKPSNYLHHVSSVTLYWFQWKCGGTLTHLMYFYKVINAFCYLNFMVTLFIFQLFCNSLFIFHIKYQEDCTDSDLFLIFIGQQIIT